MPTRRMPQTWRLLRLSKTSYLPCAACGRVHHYLTRVSTVGDCMPVLFPPGMPAPGNVGVEVELFLLGPVEDDAPSPGERSHYYEVAERVRRSSVRCEGCGERFTDLEAYRVHACEVHYR
jgi:hypothetical protein